MGNNQSLRRSIQKERWHDVRHILSTEDGKARARTKSYVVSDESVTALHLACWHKAPADVVHMLIITGQPMMESMPNHLSPLHFSLMAKSTPSPEVVRLLLDAFPHDVSRPTSRVMGSKTPLHMACEQKASTDVIRMLHEADPLCSEVKNALGQTALDVARLHSWVFNPKWRRKVGKILKSNEHPEANGQLPAAPEIPPPAPPRSPSSSSSSPGRPSSPAVATATLIVADDNAATSQLPVAAATLVETPAAASLTPTAPPDTMDTAFEEKGVCVLCWDKKSEVALVPCGHVCLCTLCCNEVDVLNAALNRQCPVCRRTFHQTLRVYQAGISSS